MLKMTSSEHLANRRGIKERSLGEGFCEVMEFVADKMDKHEEEFSTTKCRLNRFISCEMNPAHITY